jgi:hypothetical protein
MEIKRVTHATEGAAVDKTNFGWRLTIPSGDKDEYRLAQIDDYTGFIRKALPHTPPCSVQLQARVSSENLPGTWGFGFWNDPFGFSLGFGGKRLRFPVLPQTAWFMHASPPNWLSLKDINPSRTEKSIPANGFYCGTFRSPMLPSLIFLPALLGLPLIELRPVSRILRRLVGKVIYQDAVQIPVDVTQWHEYSLNWMDNRCLFRVDGMDLLDTPISPRARLGFVLWIDNQFAAWTPNGRIGYGTLKNPAAWLEITRLIFQERST